MSFYARKMPEILLLPDGFKRRYMMSAFKEMMKGYRDHFSFLGMKMPKMPGMPGMPAMPGMPPAAHGRG
jgi:anaerobic magnesium-protoporphyrin IX monomethyl ester cyclase